LEKYQIMSAIIGLILFGMIIWLVRRDHLHGRFAIIWFVIGLSCALLGIFPTITDWVASRIGIAYPPILAMILGIGFLVIKLIIMDIERSKNEVKLLRLTQRLAMLEGELLKLDNNNTE
jgi:hypothetical protein